MASPPARSMPSACSAARKKLVCSHGEACGFVHRSRHRTPINGSIKYRVLTRAKGSCEFSGAGCCLASPASTGPGGGPHPAQEPWRFGRPQQPAGPLLPLQCRQAMGGARRAVCSARWRTAVGCCWRTNWRFTLPMPIRDAWAQPGDSAAAWGRWVGVAPAGIERDDGVRSGG